MQERDALRERLKQSVSDLPDEFDADPFEEDPDYEFKVATIRPQLTAASPGLEALETHAAPSWSPDEWLEEMLSDGWQLDDHISCPPLVMLIFSREKGDSE